jgi:ubiquinone/menaquinone biosynthesis C-methylase UbiE
MKVKEYFDSVAKNFDALAGNVGVAPWADWAWHIIAKEVGKASGCLIVDLGCGTGLTLLNLLRFTSGARFLGVDFSEEMICKAREKDYGGSEVEFRVTRIDRLRLSPHSVDHFVSFGTFHHIRNKARVLKNLSGMLRPGGKFVNADLFRLGGTYLAELQELRRLHPEATAQNDRKREELQWIYDRDRSHPREFHTDPYEFKKLLEDAGIGPARVHVSLQPGFALVVGEKRNDLNRPESRSNSAGY